MSSLLELLLVPLSSFTSYRLERMSGPAPGRLSFTSFCLNWMSGPAPGQLSFTSFCLNWMSGPAPGRLSFTSFCLNWMGGPPSGRLSFTSFRLDWMFGPLARAVSWADGPALPRCRPFNGRGLQPRCPAAPWTGAAAGDRASPLAEAWRGRSRSLRGGDWSRLFWRGVRRSLLSRFLSL